MFYSLKKFSQVILKNQNRWWNSIKFFYLLDERDSCTHSSFAGECVPYAECSFTRNVGELVSPEFLSEINKRAALCTKNGLICCEKSLVSATTSSTTQIPRQSNNKPIYSLANWFLRFSTILIDAEVTPQADPTKHENFKIFKNLKCGPSSRNRVANGKYRINLLKFIEMR